MRRPLLLILLALAFTSGLANPAAAQDAPAPPCACPPAPDRGAWFGSAGLGLSMNRGNTDTTNINVSFDGTYDPKSAALWKLEGLYLRGETDGELSVDRLFTRGRYEHNLTPRFFAFGELQYLRDEFKSIDYLVAPTGGIGYKVVDSPRVTFAVDAGGGVKWEKNPGLEVITSGTISAGDRFEYKISSTASVTQRFSALWKANDFGDALYAIGAGLAANVTGSIELRFEVLDTVSTRPPDPSVKKSDVALLTALVYKF